MKKQTGKKQKTSISIRLNILFFCVFILFSAIIFQLGKVQIVDGETYKNQVEKMKMQQRVYQFPVGKFMIEKGNRLLIIEHFVRLRIQD